MENSVRSTLVSSSKCRSEAPRWRVSALRGARHHRHVCALGLASKLHREVSNLSRVTWKDHSGKLKFYHVDVRGGVGLRTGVRKGSDEEPRGFQSTYSSTNENPFSR